VAVNLDRQAVDVERQVALAVTTASGAQTAPGDLGHRLAQHPPVHIRAQRVEQPRQGGLRSEMMLGCQGGGATLAGRGEAQGRVETQRVGIVLVAPALAERDEHGAQQVGQGVGHQARMARVGEALDKPGDDAGPLQDLAQQHRPGVAAQPLGPGLDGEAAVEAGREQG
jgi:hypothetical protein